MSDPIGSIEEERAQMDMGVVANRLVIGAREDGASWWIAFLIVAAWFRAAMASDVAPPDES